MFKSEHTQKTTPNIHTFVSDVLQMQSKEEKQIYTQQEVRFEDRNFFPVLDTDQEIETQMKTVAPKRILRVNKASEA